MTIGRNQPCSCGSGKKYKRCCLPRHTAESKKTQAKLEELSSGSSLMNISDMPITGNVIPMNPASAYQNRNTSFTEPDDEDLSSTLENMMYFFHQWSLKKLPHIKEYKKLRKFHSEILTSMAQYLHAGKFEHKIDAAAGMAMSEDIRKQRGSKDPVTLRLTKTNYDMNTYEGEQAYYDMHIYKMAPNANSITEVFIQSRRYRKPEKIALLEAMHNSVRGLFEIIEIDNDQGYVHLKEVFNGQLFKVIDIGMSMKPDNSDMYVYRRIITVGEISMGAGVTLTFEKTDRFIKEFIKREKIIYHPAGEMVRFNELYNYYTTAQNKIAQSIHEIR